MAEKPANFVGIFWANLAGKQSVKKQWILWLFSGQISREIDGFCADQTSVFNVFLTEVVTRGGGTAIYGLYRYVPL